MPQSSSAMRALMKKWFGSSVDDGGPTRFLESRGYEFSQGGLIAPPTPAHTISFEEEACIRFLIFEWDYDCHKFAIFKEGTYPYPAR